MDDMTGVPFLFLNIPKRPVSRPSSRASSHSFRLNRPDTPNSIPSSPLALSSKRMFAPLASPKFPLREMATSHFTTNGRGSPLASGSPGPLGSPKLLNAKASEFRPSPRPSSAAGSSSSLLGIRMDSSSPDLWSHKSSNLAIAAPLVPDSSLLSTRSISSLAKDAFPHEGDTSEFDPFGTKSPLSLRSSALSTSEKELPSNTSDDSSIQDMEVSTPTTESLHPFDDFSTIFKSTLSQIEIDEALERNGYDFEATRVWIEANTTVNDPPSPTPDKTSHDPMDLDGSPSLMLYCRTGLRGRPFPRIGYRSSHLRHQHKLCRYYLAGECMRADCRFRCV